ncbi:hypothetical protein ACSS6N_07620 [Peribacillus frigoritolerans]|uniref:hypothetical protein n=1 Tax=Peribacillus frigoritolerans TaxID=450367 RepID=UPI003F86101B
MKRIGISQKKFIHLFGISVYDGMFGPGQATMLMYTFLRNGATYLQSLAFTSSKLSLAVQLHSLPISWPVTLHGGLPFITRSVP